MTRLSVASFKPSAVLFASLLVTTSACASAPAARREAPVQRHPLIVVVVVDQMRGQYLDDYGAKFTAGFKRLMTGGAWFRRAAYPYLNTITCAGHSTIGTGAMPYRHGMILNAWWDRASARSNPCTSDPSAKNIGYAGNPSGGDSAGALLAPPLGQQVREKGGRSVSLSLKARSAITMVGKDATAVLWFDERTGWTTSSAFTGKPLDWIQQFVEANPLERDRGRVWERLLPPTAYVGDEEGKGERSVVGWTPPFPHRVGEPPAQFLAQWQRSPFADEYLVRLAIHAVDTLDLGRGPTTDFISVSFSSLDLVGHRHGPASYEVQDMLFRLDRTIATLLDHLDARLGREGYVLALAADHGVAEIPEQSGGGRVASAAITAAIEKALTQAFGPGKYVARAEYTNIYLAAGVLAKLQRSPQASDAVLDAARAVPGIAYAFRSDEVDGPEARASADPVKRAAALSHNPSRSGDLIVVPRPNWILSSDATSHGTLYPYDQRVPVIFFGAGVQPAVLDSPATPADIAPTLATLAGVSFSAPDGTPLLKR